jgi:hypothetical protein
MGIPLYIFYVPMERFFDGMDQENSKTQEGKNGGKKKKRLLHMWRFPYSCVLHRSGTPTTLVQPSLRRTHLYGNPTYNIMTSLLCWVMENPFFLLVCMMHNIGW